jgi:hypothetical protein
VNCMCVFSAALSIPFTVFLVCSIPAEFPRMSAFQSLTVLKVLFQMIFGFFPAIGLRMTILLLHLLQEFFNFRQACFLLCNSVQLFASFKSACHFSFLVIIALLNSALFSPVFVSCVSLFMTFLRLLWIFNGITLFEMSIKPIRSFFPAIRLRTTLFEIFI